VQIAALHRAFLLHCHTSKGYTAATDVLQSFLPGLQVTPSDCQASITEKKKKKEDNPQTLSPKLPQKDERFIRT
jgi:hypothetical protein